MNAQFTCHSLADTRRLADFLSGIAQPNDVILLEGELGAGKTQFVTFFCEAAGCQDSVSSPSYTLVNMYEGQKSPIAHADLYRIKSELELYDLGFEDYLNGSIALVEWGSKHLDLFDNYLKVGIAQVRGCEECRAVSLEFKGASWEKRYEAFQGFAK